MSRAVVINASAAEVRAACTKGRLAVTALEPLQSGGIRVVLSNRAGADVLSAAFKNRLVEGTVTRTPLRTR